MLNVFLMINFFVMKYIKMKITNKAIKENGIKALNNKIINQGWDKSKNLDINKLPPDFLY